MAHILRLVLLAILSLCATSSKTNMRLHNDVQARVAKRDLGLSYHDAWTAADLASARSLKSGKLQGRDFVYGTVRNVWQTACLGKAQAVASQTGKPVHAYYLLKDDTSGFVDLNVAYLFPLEVICVQTTKEATSIFDYGTVVADWAAELIGSLSWDKASATTAANKVAQQLAGPPGSTGNKTKS